MNNTPDTPDNEETPEETPEVTEGIYEADTFRDNRPIDQIHHDYEVWDRHYG